MVSGLRRKLHRGDNPSWEYFWDKEKAWGYRLFVWGLVLGLEVDVFVGGILVFPDDLIVLGQGLF